MYSDFFAFEIEDSDEASRRQASKENSARQATIEATFISTGTGQVSVSEPFTFPITFLSQPHFTSGSAVMRNPDPKKWHDPVGGAGIRAWKTNTKGHFIGAYIWTRVDMYALGSDPGAGVLKIDDFLIGDLQGRNRAKTLHYLTFTGMSFKDVPFTDMSDELTPRQTFGM